MTGAERKQALAGCMCPRLRRTRHTYRTRQMSCWSCVPVGSGVVLAKETPAIGARRRSGTSRHCGAWPLTRVAVVPLLNVLNPWPVTEPYAAGISQASSL
jgi:hypothetical protein